MQRPPFVQTTIICIWTALTIRAETLVIIKWSKEARSWTEICTCCACISISAISEGNFCWARFRSSKSGGVIGLTGMIRKGKAHCVDSADTVCAQEYHVHLNVDDLWFLPADFLSPSLHHFKHPWSLRWWPIEQMATVLITDCVHTTRASSRWCSLNHPWVALAASTPSHLLCTRRRHYDDLWSKRISKSLEEATFSEQCAKNLSVTIMSDRLVYS